MNDQQKILLKDRFLERIETLGISQNEAAKRIGISAATITNIKKGKWENITDAWKKLSQWLGSDQWQIVPTKNLNRIQKLCAHAQGQGVTKAVSFRQGSGKSCGAKYYARHNKNAFYLEAEPHYTKKVFLQKLSRAMGLSIHGGISAMVDDIIEKLNSLNRPLVIIDEFDQLAERVLPFFKTFYNKTNAGFVLIGGEHFSKRIMRGVNLTKQSYCETYSRLGAEFLTLHATNTTMIKSICEANGVFEKAMVDRIAATAKGDLRRVKNEVEKIHLLNQLQPQHV